MATALQMLAAFLVSLAIFIAIFLAIFGNKIFAVVVPYIAKGLAEGKFFGRKNFGFTIVDEAQCKTIKMFGQFERCVMVYEGFGLDQYWNIRHTDENGKEEKHWDESSREWVTYTVSLRPLENGGTYTYNKVGTNGQPGAVVTTPNYPGRIPSWMPHFISRHLPGGIWWIGNPFTHSIHEYNFLWTTLRQKQDGGKLVDSFYTQDRSDGTSLGPLDYINLNDDVYVASIDGAETKDPIPVDVVYALTIRVVNPYKALFRVEQWLEATINRTMPSIRAWIANKTFVEAIEKKETIRREEDVILKDSEIGDYTDRHWGVRIKASNVKSISPVGGQSIFDATNAEYRAGMAAKAAVKTAEGDKQATIIRAQGEAEAFTTVAKAIEAEPMGETILTARTLQEMSKNPAATIVHANKMSGILLNVPAGSKPEAKPDGGNQ